MSASADLRRRILELAAQYQRSRREEEASPFVPGKSRVPYAGRVYGEEEVVALVDSALEFWLTAGRFAERFEREFASLLGLPHALLVNSGSSANLLAFAALASPLLGERRVRPGDEVITVACGFPTTVAPIVQLGAVPVFVDVTFPSCNVDCEHLEEAFTPRTRAVMLAHTLGNPFDIDRVTEFCRRRRLWLIEDNCDALGSTWRGRLTGTFGDVGTSSFYPPHHLTMGEGGAVYCSDPLLARIVLSLRDWGRDCTCPPGRDNTCGERFSRRYGELPIGYDHKYVYSHLGFNLKATDMQAAVGCAQLARFPSFVARRRENFAFFARELADLAEFFHLPEAAADSEPSWFGFLLTVREGAPFTRDQAVRFLEDRRIQTRALFAGNLLRHPCFDALRGSGRGYRTVGNLKNTDAVMERSFWFGVYPGLTGEMAAYVAQSLHDLARQAGKDSR